MIVSQIPLSLHSKLIYEPSTFFLHSGVKETYKKIEFLIEEDEYFLCIVRGEARSGKTHLGISLSDSGCQYYDDILSLEEISKDQVLILDDADKRMLNPDFCGFFVALCEDFLKAKKGLVLFTTQELQTMTNDPSVLSRLESGFNLEIKPPSDDTFGEVIFRIGLQRGIHFSEKQIAFLEKRISRDISKIEDYVEKLSANSVLEGEKIVYSTMRGSL